MSSLEINPKYVIKFVEDTVHQTVIKCSSMRQKHTVLYKKSVNLENE